MSNNRTPIVRPPRFAGQGGAGNAFGSSGAPALPETIGERARALALSYADDERGRWTERVFTFPDFAALAPGVDDTQQLEITSNRTDFVRLVAFRGILQATDTLPLSGLELAQLRMKLQINGEEDFTTGGNVSRASSFATLFATTSAPWFFLAAPPRLRVGDLIQCNVQNVATGESPTLTPEVALKIVDDQWWRILYGGGLFDQDR